MSPQFEKLVNKNYTVQNNLITFLIYGYDMVNFYWHSQNHNTRNIKLMNETIRHGKTKPQAQQW